MQNIKFANKIITEIQRKQSAADGSSRCIVAVCAGYPHSLKPDEVRAVGLGVSQMNLTPYFFSEYSEEMGVESQEEWNKKYHGVYASLFTEERNRAEYVRSLNAERRNPLWRGLFNMLQYVLNPSPAVIKELLELPTLGELTSIQAFKALGISSDELKTLDMFDIDMKKLKEIQDSLESEIRPNPKIWADRKNKLAKLRPVLLKRLLLDAEHFVGSQGKNKDIILDEQERNKKIQESQAHYVAVAVDILYWMSAKDPVGGKQANTILLGMHGQPPFVTQIRNHIASLFGRDQQSLAYIEIKLESSPTPTCQSVEVKTMPVNIFAKRKSESIEKSEMSQSTSPDEEKRREMENKMMFRMFGEAIRLRQQNGKTDAVASFVTELAYSM